MNNKKKKRIYSKIKGIYVKSEKPLENPVQMVSHIYNIKNIWVDFIDKIMYKKDTLNLSEDNNLLFILNEINNNSQKKEVLKNLMLLGAENYNPFTDNVPIDKLPTNISRLIEKKQQYIKEYYNFKENIDLKYEGIRYNTLITYNNPYIDTQELFKEYDIIVLFNENFLVFSSNPNLDKRPDFTKLYNKLNGIEPDKWYIHGNKGFIKTEQGKSSNISIFDIFDL